MLSLCLELKLWSRRTLLIVAVDIDAVAVRFVETDVATDEADARRVQAIANGPVVRQGHPAQHFAHEWALIDPGPPGVEGEKIDRPEIPCRADRFDNVSIAVDSRVVRRRIPIVDAGKEAEDAS